MDRLGKDELARLLGEHSSCHDLGQFLRGGALMALRTVMQRSPMMPTEVNLARDDLESYLCTRRFSLLSARYGSDPEPNSSALMTRSPT